MTMNLGQLPTYESLLPVLRTQTTSYSSYNLPLFVGTV